MSAEHTPGIQANSAEDPIPPPSMGHPQSPMGPGLVAMQEGHTPSSPPPDHRHHIAGSDPMGYRQPHASGYGPPPGYPHYPPYSASPHSPYGAPHHGYNRAPPGNYPAPHHSPSYGYGYPGAGSRPPYPYAYESSYPGQPSRQQPPYRADGHPRTNTSSRQASQQPHTASPPKSSPTGKNTPTRSPEIALRAPKIPDHVEVERLRAAAATELTHEEVKPIRTDFHFFVKKNSSQFRKLAEEEIRKSSDEETLDPFLVNSNMNARLMKAWEDLVKEERDGYMVQEEEDRRRFMEEDEIASRHCATLTARGKSPRSSDKVEKGKKEERQEQGTKQAVTPEREVPKIQKSKEILEVENENGESISGGTGNHIDRNREMDPSKKRTSPVDSHGMDEEMHESPSKRGRTIGGMSS